MRWRTDSIINKPKNLLATKTGPLQYSVKMIEIFKNQLLLSLFSVVVSAAEIAVTTHHDELDLPASGGTGISLREAIRDAAPGDTIIFDASLNGMMFQIPEDSSFIFDKSLTIDGSDLASGVSIRPHYLKVEAGVTMEFRKVNFSSLSRYPQPCIENLGILKMQDCKVSNSSALDNAFFLNKGELLLKRTDFIDNHSSDADSFGRCAGITNSGTATIEECLFQGLYADLGGEGSVFENYGMLTVINTTVHDVIGYKSAIYNDPSATLHLTNFTISQVRALAPWSSVLTNRGQATLSHCTITDNSSEESVFVESPPLDYVVPAVENSGTMHLLGNIIRDNYTLGWDDSWHYYVLGEGDFGSGEGTHSLGGNIIGSLPDHSLFVASGDQMGIANPINLAPLGYYGGLTPTRLPHPGSVAINNAMSSSVTDDQRGLLRNGQPDSGATEYQVDMDLVHFWDSDFDRDGMQLGVEYLIGTDPLAFDVNAPEAVIVSKENGAAPIISFGYDPEALAEADLILKRSTDLNVFTEIYSTVDGALPGVDASHYEITDPSGEKSKAFYRLEAVLKE